MIETVISPRDGCKLVVRSSKGNGQEDYYVDAVEVVSFGHSFFFRSLERPKSFLVPVSDYEILELRETRMVLKNVSSERSIKIGGGREAPAPRLREPQSELTDTAEEQILEQSAPAPQNELRQDRGNKRDRRRRGRRGGRDRDVREQRPAVPVHAEITAPSAESIDGKEEPSTPVEVKAPSFMSKLFPPPSTLIKETLGRYKQVEPVEPSVHTDESLEETSSNESEEYDPPETNLED